MRTFHQENKKAEAMQTAYTLYELQHLQLNLDLPASLYVRARQENIVRN